ncbi:metallophosphoesterase family protein [Thermobifida halotolerans]|uniref:metallophosphoesterase family protein n=1 Tax=Thermobifida halotolerans TaxID=483545 RepID=UPI000A8F6432
MERRAVLARIGPAFHPEVWGRLRNWFGRVRRGWVWRVAAVLLAGIAGGWVGLAVGGQVLTPVGPADVNLSVSPSWHGETVINIAPLGKLAFDTHAAPLRFEATIAEIRLAAAEEMFQNPDSINRLGASIVSDLKQGIVALAWRAVLFSVGTAALGALLLFRSWARALLSALTALTMLVAGSGATYLTFNPGAIAEPRYTGLLAGAPQVVGSAEDVINHFSEYQAQLAGLVGNVSQLYQVTSALPVYEQDASTIRVLHVSDLHLNPAAWEVIGSLVEQFQVHVVVDSGDISDRGSAAEDVFMDQIADLDVPYVWVRGNHDSMGTQRAVAAQPNAVVLDDDIAEVAGLRFYGAGDPRFTPDKALDNPTNEEVAAIGAEQARGIEDADPPVDVAVLHDPLQGAAFSGVVPLVLSGHGHKRWTEVRETGTRFFVQGSTGGAGLRGLEHDEPTPYEASVLYFDAETKRLHAWDDITLGGLGLSSAQIERHVETDPDREIVPLPATPGPSVTPSPTSTPTGAPTPTPTATGSPQ